MDEFLKKVGDENLTTSRETTLNHGFFLSIYFVFSSEEVKNLCKKIMTPPSPLRLGKFTRRANLSCWFPFRPLKFLPFAIVSTGSPRLRWNVIQMSLQN